MALPTSIAALAQGRISHLLREVTQEIEERPRFFQSQIAEPMALENEVFMFTGQKVVAADIIQLDQKSVMRRATDTYRIASTTVPKFKHGFPIEEHMIVLMSRIAQGLCTHQEIAQFDNYVANHLRWLVEGIHDRKELVYSQLFINSGTYDRLGIMFQNFNWGVQDANLSPTALAGAAQWTMANVATATPIANLRALLDYARRTYSIRYDTLKIDETLFNVVVSTTEFQALAPTYAAMILGTVSAGQINATFLKGLTWQVKTAVLGAILGVNVVLNTPYKPATQIQANDGSMTSTAFWDPTYICLYDSTIFDGGVDFANTTVIETMAGLVPLMLGTDFPMPMEGPVAYATASDPHGDPPGEILWAVQRGWPRLNNYAKKVALKVY